ERLGFIRSQLGDDPPVVAAPHEVLVGVLHPDDGNQFPPRPLDKAADVRDDSVALVSLLDDAVLHVDDEERGVRPVLECRHGLPSYSCWVLCAPKLPGGAKLAAGPSTCGRGGALSRWCSQPPATGRPPA